jgi:hypothetical protein
MKRLWIATAVALVAMSAVAAASTGLGKATSFSTRFTTSKPGTPTGLFMKTTGAPPAAGVTLPDAVQQTVTLPAGTKLRLGLLPQCRASDADIAAKGAEGACPSSARVGSGGADGVLDGSPTHFDVGIYAVRGHLVFAAEQSGKPLRQSFDGVVKRGRLVLTVPTLGGRIAPTEFDAKLASRNGWLVTPKRCPRSGHWASRGRFQGVNGVGGGAATAAQTLTAKLPCRG